MKNSSGPARAPVPKPFDFNSADKNSYMQMQLRVKNGSDTESDRELILVYEDMCRKTIAAITDVSITNDFGCIYSTGAFHDGSNERKMCKIQGAASRSELYLQQLAAIAGGQGLQVLETVSYFDDAFGVGKRKPKNDLTHQCSHDCHNSVCMNPDHITVRRGNENREQNFCRAFTVGGVKMTTCTHIPQCMLASSVVVPYTGGAPRKRKLE